MAASSTYNVEKMQKTFFRSSVHISERITFWINVTLLTRNDLSLLIRIHILFSRLITTIFRKSLLAGYDVPNYSQHFKFETNVRKKKN